MTKKIYTAPHIERNQTGNMNKYGAKSVVRHQDNIDGIPITKLVEEFGSPLLVLSEKHIRRHYRRLLEVMQMNYPRVEMAWSYKTNYLGAVCSIYHQEGAKAEVVSGMEYAMARKLGVPALEIIFNGPGKKKDELRLAIKEGARIHIDHLDELYMIEKIASDLDIIPEVGIRVNMDTGIYPLWTRFGFNYENGEAYRAIQRLVSGKKMTITTLHAHIGTFIMDPHAYYLEAKALLTLAAKVKDELGIVIKNIDLGGGFASQNTLIDQYTPGELSAPTYDQYASEIGAAFNDSHFVSETLPTLYLETGRALIDEAGYFIATVLGKKNLPTGERAVILDAGVNTLITAWWYKLKVLPTRPFPEAYQNTVFFGPLCMNIDIIRSAFPFPDLYTGEQVVIFPAGAYNNTQWMQFIEYRPAVILISETGNPSLIREREELNDIIEREIIPEHLKHL
jgi:diaminopimelate decarboxylase